MTPELKKLSEEAAALLPCPFCGGAATIEPKNWAGRDYIGVFSTECLIFQDSPSATDAEASAAWNTRARLAEPEADAIAALEAENATLAAGACHVEGGLIGDEHGHFYCAMERKVAALEAENARLRGVLQAMVYETTHLSPCRPDGSHDCRISGEALAAARAALNRSPNDD